MYNKKSKLFLDLYKPYTKRLVLLFLLLLTASVLATFPSVLTGRIVDNAIAQDWRTLAHFAVLLLIVILLQRTAGIASNRLTALTMERIHRDLVLRLCKKALALDYMSLHTKKRGDLLQTILTDTETVKQISVDSLISFIFQTITAIVAGAFIFRANKLIFLCILLVYSINFLPLQRVSKHRQTVEKELRNTTSETRQKLIQTFDTIREIKLYGMEEKEIGEYGELQSKWGNLTKKKYIITNGYKNIPRLLDAIAPAIVYIIGGYSVIQHRQSVGDIVMLTGLIGYLNTPIKMFAQFFMDIKHLDAISNGMFEIAELSDEASSGRTRTVDGIMEIRFENVSCSMDQRKDIFKNVSFRLEPGDRLAIIGETGSGKSTILRMLCGLVTPSNGRILLNGDIPLSSVDLKSYRSNVAYADQSSDIFNDTIENNIRFLCRDADINKDLLEKIGVTALTEKNKDALGETVNTVSGGERQRISFARAMLSRRSLVLLDEITAEQDVGHEKTMMESLLDPSCKDKIIVFTAHRLSNLKYANKVLYIRDGSVAAFGAPEQLYEQNVLYKEYLSRQDTI